MPKKSDELVHQMPLSVRVKLSLSRVNMSYDEQNKKTIFSYQFDNWTGEGDVPIINVSIDDWDTNEKAHRGELRRTTNSAIDQEIMNAIISHFSQ
jgi:hypothetical protein